MVVSARSGGFICHVVTSPRFNCQLETGSVLIIENNDIYL